MNPAEIYEQLSGIIRDVLDDDSIELGPETVAADVSGWDSAAHIFILVGAETRFGIKFHTSEMEELRNVGEFVSLIQQKLDGANR